MIFKSEVSWNVGYCVKIKIPEGSKFTTKNKVLHNIILQIMIERHHCNNFWRLHFSFNSLVFSPIWYLTYVELKLPHPYFISDGRMPNTRNFALGIFNKNNVIFVFAPYYCIFCIISCRKHNVTLHDIGTTTKRA